MTVAAAFFNVTHKAIYSNQFLSNEAAGRMKLNDTHGVSSITAFIANVITQHMSSIIQNVDISVIPTEANINNTVL